MQFKVLLSLFGLSSLIISQSGEIVVAGSNTLRRLDGNGVMRIPLNKIGVMPKPYNTSSPRVRLPETEEEERIAEVSGLGVVVLTDESVSKYVCMLE
jgi:hypothetical protein